MNASRQLRSATILVSALLSFLLTIAAETLAEDSPEEAFFKKKIEPVLSENCYECHSKQAKKLRAGLLLDSREGLRRGGGLGRAVIPGSPGESVLIRALEYTDDDLHMPPNGKLSDKVIEDFRQWIRDGAVDPRTKKRSTVAARSSALAWARRPLAKSLTPEASTRGASRRVLREPMDYWLVSSSNKAKKLPSRSKAWLSRVYADLVESSPSAETLEEFLADESPAAKARVVDSLLSSPEWESSWRKRWLIENPKQFVGEDFIWQVVDSKLRSLKLLPPVDSPTSPKSSKARDDAIGKPSPIASRFLANAIYEHHFKSPLVRFRTIAPSSRRLKLLDHLAGELAKHPTPVRALQRAIVLSASYSIEVEKVD